VYVTHDQEEALVLSDRVAVFNRGNIEQVGSPEELYERPRTTFVAEFVGESNIFIGPAVVDKYGDRWVVWRSPMPRGVAADNAIDQVIMIRPERLRVELSCRSDLRMATMRGRVRQIVYVGPTRRIEVEMTSGCTLIAREVAAQRSQLSEGDDVCVRSSPEGSVLLGHAAGGGTTGNHSLSASQPDTGLASKS
jgi:putative spermidine/putrescine transport system ATP-binding protein